MGSIAGTRWRAVELRSTRDGPRRAPTFSLACTWSNTGCRSSARSNHASPATTSSASSLSAFAVSASADHIGCSVSTNAAPLDDKRNSRRRPSRRSARSAMRPALRREARVWLMDGWLIASTAASSFTDIGPRRASRLSTPSNAVQRRHRAGNTPGWHRGRCAPTGAAEARRPTLRPVAHCRLTSRSLREAIEGWSALTYSVDTYGLG